MFLCVFSDREQGLGSPSNEGGGSEKSVQDSFFLIWYGGRGGEAAVLFFLALALTTLSGYWSGALMQTCQINFAGREGCDCCEIASTSQGGERMDGWIED